MSLNTLLKTLKRPATELRGAFRVGSRVYGNARPDSDEDFLAVLADKKARKELAFGDNVNVIVHGPDDFQKALEEHSMLALECHFAPREHRIVEPRPPFSLTLDRRRLEASVRERSTSDFEKGRKRFEDEPGPSRKKIFHALRVLIFARQIAQRGKIVDFGEANPCLVELESLEEVAAVEARFSPQHRALLDELAALCKRK